MDAPSLRAGTKVWTDAGAVAIVVKSPSEGGLTFESGGSVLLGKRYRWEKCGAGQLTTGGAEFVCHGSALVIAEPNTLPSSD